MQTQKEPILWIQLLSIGLLPLEFLLLKLILAGSPLGPLPNIQRIVVAGLAIITPTFSLLRKPADWASLLFFKLPVKGRSVSQHQISNLQFNKIPKVFFLFGIIIIIYLFWNLDESALLFASISPFHKFSRIINLGFSIPLILLIIWQWHQLCFSIWLLTRSEEVLKESIYLTSEEILNSQISLGIELKCFEELSLNSSLDFITINNNQSSKKQ